MSVKSMEAARRVSAPEVRDEIHESESAQAVSTGQRISSRIISSLTTVRTSTERAVLKIGELLNSIVRAATNDDGEVRKTLQCVIGDGTEKDLNSGTPIVVALRNQGAAVSSLVDETRRFFNDQLGFTRAASKACDNIHSSASLVSELMARSQILSVNMQIESARLGQQGMAVNVIAQEMKRFASEVRRANESIKGALADLMSCLLYTSQSPRD